MTKKRNIGFLEACSIGVGGMVGGGIFATLGLAVSMAAGATPAAFLLAGCIALLTAYSYARLSVAEPSQGGTVTFLNRAFGRGWFTGSLNVLLWLSYIVMLSLYAHAFGSYGATFFPESMQFVARHGLISGAVVLVTVLNAMTADLVGKAEDWIVGLKLLILVLFVAVGIFGIEAGRLAPENWAAPLSIVAGGMIIFLAYEGFELIANTAREVKDPERTLPRAFFAAVGFVLVLYVLIAIVTVGNLAVDKIVAARDYALAAAARPFLGQFGFTLISIAALLSTFSAINATLYGSARLSYTIARDGELPEELEKRIWGKPLEGLLITSAVTLLVANTMDLSSISTIGSAGFLILFAMVNFAAQRQASKIKASRWICGAGAAACLLALGTLLWRVGSQDPYKLGFLGGMLVLAVIVELIYRRVRKRDINLLD